MNKVCVSPLHQINKSVIGITLLTLKGFMKFLLNFEFINYLKSSLKTYFNKIIQT